MKVQQAIEIHTISIRSASMRRLTIPLRSIIIHSTMWLALVWTGYVCLSKFLNCHLFLCQMLSKDTRLLKHPVVQMLLDKKLKRFGWLIYYVNLLMYLLLVSLLMAFILLLPNPNSMKCKLTRKYHFYPTITLIHVLLGLEAANASLERNLSTDKCSGKLVLW